MKKYSALIHLALRRMQAFGLNLVRFNKRQILGTGLCRFLFFAFCLQSSHVFASGKLKRIASINQCTDQFLLALADRKQIVSLSPFAGDKNSSFYANRAKGLPRIREGSESVIKLKPDILLATIYDRPNTLAIVRNQGIKVVVLPYPKTLDQILEQIAHVAREIGQEEKGKKLISEFQERIALSRDIFAKRNLSALYYQRGGYVSGRSTHIGLLLDHVGLRNHASRHGISYYGNLSLEHIVSDPPDIFLVARYNKTAEDLGHQLLEHPALLRILKKKQVVRFPVSEIVCPGPSSLAALERLIRLKNQN